MIDKHCEIFQELKKEYWLKQLKGGIGTTNIPVTHAVVTEEQHFHYYETPFPQHIFQRIMDICRNDDLSFFVFILSVIVVVLQKYNNNEQIFLRTSCFKICDLPYSDNSMILKYTID